MSVDGGQLSDSNCLREIGRRRREYKDLLNGIADRLDALAAMPEPGCEGCRWVHDDGYQSPCQRCTRGNGGDCYSPRDKAE